MTPPPSTRSLLTVPFAIPAYWTPEQALAVAELLEDLCEFVWAHYGSQFTDAYREQHLSDPGRPASDTPPGNISF